MNVGGDGFGEGLYRLALRAFPEESREVYGEEMLDAFRRERRRLRERGRAPAARFTLAASADALTAGLQERRRLGRRPGGGIIAGGGGMGALSLDFRVAVRGLWKAKGFTAVAVFSLGVGIGVGTAIFTLVNEAWIQPTPGLADAPEGIVELLTTDRGSETSMWSYMDFVELDRDALPFEELGAFKADRGVLGLDGHTAQVRLMYVTSGYFSTLGIPPVLGRTFLPEEDVGPGQNLRVVVSYDMWQNRLGGDPDVVGSTVTLNRAEHTVVGVAPQGFREHRKFYPSVDFWIPLTQHRFITGEDPWGPERRARWVQVLGRLSGGVTPGEATAALHVAFAAFEEAYPDTNEGRRAQAVPFGPIPATARVTTLAIAAGLFVLAGIVLLIVCGNVAGMSVARAATRERALAVRMALGSGRRGLIRLAMSEAFVLASLAGVLGVLLAYVGTSAAFVAGGPPGMTLRPTAPVMAFALVLTLVTTVLFGLLPALRLSRADLLGALKDDAGGGGRRAGRIHRLAASAQTGVALVLIVVGMLHFRSMGALLDRDLGFQPEGLLFTRMDLSTAGYETAAAGRAVMDRLRAAALEVPGVRSVALADGLPLDHVGNFTHVSPAEAPEEEGGGMVTEFTRAGEGYFETIGTGLLRGRGFAPDDTEGGEPVVVITQSLAERFWPGEDPLGRRVRLVASIEGARVFTVVGVVENVASSRPTDDWPHVFVSARQEYDPGVLVAMRVDTDVDAVAAAAERAFLSVDPSLVDPRPIAADALVELSLGPARTGAQASAALGALALLLSILGVYSVIAFTVSARTREIGIRMAMGASRNGVLASVLIDGMRLAGPGLAVGALVAVGIAAAMRAQLLGISPLDPVALGAGCGLLLLMVALASLAPARQASGVQPVEALRSD